MENRPNDTARMIQLFKRIKAEMNGAVVESMETRGVHYALNYGVSVPTLKAIAESCAPDHTLALLLYRQPIRELQLAAVFIDRPQWVTREQMTDWARGFTHTEIIGHVTGLFARASDAPALIREWLAEEPRRQPESAKPVGDPVPAAVLDAGKAQFSSQKSGGNESAHPDLSMPPGRDDPDDPDDPGGQKAAGGTSFPFPNFRPETASAQGKTTFSEGIPAAVAPHLLSGDETCVDGTPLAGAEMIPVSNNFSDAGNPQAETTFATTIPAAMAASGVTGDVVRRVGMPSTGTTNPFQADRQGHRCAGKSVSRPLQQLPAYELTPPENRWYAAALMLLKRLRTPGSMRAGQLDPILDRMFEILRAHPLRRTTLNGFIGALRQAAAYDDRVKNRILIYLENAQRSDNKQLGTVVEELMWQLDYME